MKNETYNKIKLFIFLLFFLFLLTSCATPRPVFPYPDFKLIEIGDMLCAPDLENKIKFDQWLEDVDKYMREVEK